MQALIISNQSSTVRCESENQYVTPISTMIEPVPWTTKVEGEEVTLNLPFICAKYRANVRVVDFRPRRLEDFATWRKKTEFDVLSDYSGGGGGGESDSGVAEESDGDDEVGPSAGGNLDAYRGQKAWEWRFALLLEGVDSKGGMLGDDGDVSALWAVVDNNEAQQLLNLDACE